MRILVYGAGVLGSYLAHRLLRSGNDVTLLARERRKASIDENGLVIRHYVQMKITVDKINTIDMLSPDDVYGIIFVVVQATHLPSVLPDLASNRSGLIVFVGNNTDIAATKNAVCQGECPPKRVVFGFQLSGGRRENGQVICVRVGSHMDFGSLDKDDGACAVVRNVLDGAKYRTTNVSDMDAWLKCHLALILPIAYAVYACGGDLRRADGKLIHEVIKAMCEGYGVLKTLGVPFLPPDIPVFLHGKPRRSRFILWLAFKTPIGRLAMSDHAMSAVEEMTALHRAFEELKEQAGIPAPSLDNLKKHMPSQEIGGAKSIKGQLC
ncbi:MAG: ketopantoate reductase family protein [Clostridiales bacterium]|jgi:2-dehydropantoate 2-reductase|nr:ketopantoate reductase family protein [Clostridiales bacterium]